MVENSSPLFGHRILLCRIPHNDSTLSVVLASIIDDVYESVLDGRRDRGVVRQNREMEKGMVKVEEVEVGRDEEIELIEDIAVE